MFFERFCELCRSKKKSPNGVANELGISSASVTKWKNGTTPSAEMVKKIALYFGVSSDYLLGIEKTSIQTALFNGEQPSEEAWKEVENFVEFIKNKYGMTE